VRCYLREYGLYRFSIDERLDHPGSRIPSLLCARCYVRAWLIERLLVASVNWHETSGVCFDVMERTC
jgi:hypothetical protein